MCHAVPGCICVRGTGTQKLGQSSCRYKFVGIQGDRSSDLDCTGGEVGEGGGYTLGVVTLDIEKLDVFITELFRFYCLVWL